MIPARWLWGIGLGLLVCLAPARHLSAQEMDLTPADQVSVLGRILAFDRSFAARADDGLVVGILYQRGYRPSLLAHNDVRTATAAIKGGILGSGEVRLVSIDASSGADLQKELRDGEVDLLYVAPMRAQDVREVARVTTALRIPTFTGVRDYMVAGLGIGVGQRGGRPEILVNLEATRSQGMDLNAQFLRVVTMIKPDDGIE